MKKLKTLLMTGVILTAMVACTNNSIETSNEEVEITQNGELNIDEASTTNDEEKVTCSEKRKDDNGSIKTCLYKSFKTVTESTEENGKYFYSYQVYEKNETGAYHKITNEQLFNSKKGELLNKVNAKIKQDYQEMRADEDNDDCFEGFVLQKYNFNDLGIAFSEDKISFSVDFDLPNYCLAVGGTTISFTWDEIRSYFR